MKRAVEFLLAVVVVTLTAIWTMDVRSQQPLDYVEGDVIIKLSQTVSLSEAAAMANGLGAIVDRKFSSSGAELWKLSGVTTAEAISQYSGDTRVEYIEPNYIVYAIDVFPNDPRFGELWGLHNTGQTGGVIDADIDAPGAWSVETGDTVLVGVIDTGVDWTHVDLAANIYTNPNEIPNNGIDDDSNGYIDDVRGWDFVNNDNNPMDDHFHGTHVSGTIAGIGNNGVGVVGVSWSARIMPIKFLNSGGSGTTANAILAIDYATMMGVRVTNNSWGGGGFSQALKDAIDAAGVQGYLFVASAGNGSRNTDISPSYPASYDLDNIISVANTNHQDQMSSSSNWGLVTVDLGAPGSNILSTMPGNSYGLLSGTSMACPHVVGAISLLWAAAPALGHLEAKSLVLAATDQIPALNGKTVSGGRLNVNTLILNLDSIPPDPIVDLAVLSTGSNTATLGWTATGDDGSSGTASAYDLRYSTSLIDAGNFGSATPVPGVPAPLPAGASESYMVTGLNFTTQYFFAVRVLDEQLNTSPVSNSPSGTTLGIPEMFYSPASFADSLLTGVTSTHFLTIANVAVGTLDFEFTALPAWISANPNSGRVLAGDSLDVEIVFDAFGLFDGLYAGNVVLGTNDPNQLITSIPVDLHVTGAPDIVVSETGLDYGQLFIGVAALETLVVDNSGTDVLVVTDVSADHGDYTADVANFVLNPGEDRDVVVTFVPSSVGVKAATLTFTSDDPDEPTLGVSLTGEGVEPPVIGVSPSTLSDSLFTGESSMQIFTIENSGGSDLTFDISLSGFSSSQILARVTTKPGSVGDRPASMGALRRPAGGVASTGTGPEETAGGGHQLDGGVPPATSAIILEDDFEDGDFNGWLSAGPGTKEVTGATAADGTQKSYHETNAPSGHYDGIYQEFGSSTPGYIGFYIRSASVSSDDAYVVFRTSVGSEAIWFFARGNGFLYCNADVGGDATVPYVANQWYHIEYREINFSSKTFDYYVDGNLIVAGISFRSQAADLYRVEVYSFSQSAEAWWDQIFVSTGEEPARWLAVGTDTGVVPAGQSVEVEVNFDATGLDGANYFVAIVVATNDPFAPKTAVLVWLHVTGAPDITVSETALNYGDVYIGVATLDTVVVLNHGTDLLAVSSISADHATYTADATSFNLNPGEEREVVVTFLPTGVGVVPATLTITNNDPDDPVVFVSLTGNGVEPPVIGVSPSSLSDDLFTGGTSEQTLTIENSGGSALVWNSALRAIVNQTQYTLTIPEQVVANLDDGAVAENVRTTAITATLEDLTDVRILFDNAHGQSSSFSWSTIIADLTLRGATVDINAAPITPALLADYDAFWTTDLFIPWGATELTALTNWIGLGGGLILEGDNTSTVPIYNTLLTALGAGIAYDLLNGASGTTTNIFPHETTDGVGSIFLSANIAHISTVTFPADNLVNDVQNVPNSAYSMVGQGRIIAMADEVFHNSRMGVADNQLFANQVFDWVASGVDWLAISPTEGTIVSSGNTDLTVIFDAAGLNGGGYDAEIILGSNDPVDGEVIVPVHLDVTGAPDIAVSDTTLGYGVVYIGVSVLDTMVIENVGTDVLTVSSIAANHAAYTADVANVVLNSGEHQDVVITFLPTAVGVASATLTIASDDPDEAVVVVSLTGEGVEPPIVGVSPSSLSDSLFTGGMSTQILTINNTGGSELLFDISLGSFSSSFVLEKPLTKEEAGHGRPASGVAATDPTGAVASNAFEPEETAGEGFFLDGYAPPTASAIILEDDFEDGDFNGWLSAGSGIKEVTSVTGADGTLKSFHQTNSPGGHFDGVYREFGTSTPGYIGFYIRSSSASSNDAYVVFRDSAGREIIWFFALATSVLYCNGSSPGGDQSVPYVANQWYHIEYREINFTSDTFDYYVDDNLIAAGVSFRNFTTDLYRADLYGFDLNAESWWDQIFISTGEEPARWLTVDPSSGVVPAFGSVDVEVTFDATGLNGGDYAATLIVSTNDPVTPITVVPAQLHVTGAPDIVLSTNSLEFSAAFVGHSVSDTVYVSNVGTDNLVVSGMTFDDAHYTAVPSSFTVAIGGSELVLVTFAPTEPGPAPGAMRISSNDPDEPVVTVALTGESMNPPAVEVTPVMLSADVPPGASETQQIKIDNTAGASALNWEVFMTSTASASVAIKAARKAGAVANVEHESRYKSYAGMIPDPDYRVSVLPATDPGTIAFNRALQSTVSNAALVFFDDMESGTNGWTHYLVNPVGVDQWAQTTARSSSATTSWRVSQHGTFGSDALQSPPIDLTNQSDATLFFQHWYNFDSCGGDPEFEPDGGIVEVSVNGGTTWTQIFPVGGYPYVLDDICGNPLAFYDVYTHDGGNGPAFIPAVFELTAYAGNVISLRFHAGWDCGNCGPNEGWYIDDVGVVAVGVGWLSANPSSGSVPAGSDQVVDVTFDATGLYGSYSANLVVASNDPVNPQVIMPVALSVDSTSSVTGINESGVPEQFALHSNYPNPFNPATTIRFDLPATVAVRLDVYNVKGQRVITLIDHEKSAGSHTVPWNGRDFSGAQVATGVYFYRLRAGNFDRTRKMVLMK